MAQHPQKLPLAWGSTPGGWGPWEFSVDLMGHNLVNCTCSSVGKVWKFELLMPKKGQNWAETVNPIKRLLPPYAKGRHDTVNSSRIRSSLQEGCSQVAALGTPEDQVSRRHDELGGAGVGDRHAARQHQVAGHHENGFRPRNC